MEDGDQDMSKTDSTRSDKGARRVEYQNVLVLAISFFMVFAAFLAIENLQSSLNQSDGLGVASLSCLYVTFILSGFIAPLFIRFLGAKWTICLSFFIHSIYSAANFHATWWSLIPASILLGLISGPIWTAQGKYITHCARSYANLTSEPLHAIISRFGGIFFALFLFSAIIGNLISSLVLFTGENHSRMNVSTLSEPLNESVMLTPTKICGADDCPIEQIETNVSVYDTADTRPPQSAVYTLFGTFLSLVVIGLLIAVIFLPKLPKPGPTVTVKSTLISCVAINVDLKMILLIPSVVSQCMIITIMFADFGKSYVSCTIGIGMLGFVMTANAVASFVFSLTIGRLAKYTGRQPLIVTLEIVYTGILIGLYVWKPTRDDFYVFFVVSAIWGIGEPIACGQGIALLVAVYPDNSDAAFANFHSWRAFGFMASFAMSKFLCVSTKLIITGCVHLLGFVLYVCMEVILWREKRRQVGK